MTSFGVVSKVRGIMRIKKAGHTGTLDPMATGVLPIMLESSTRFLNFLPDSDKGYKASFILGKTTDTLDITGKVLSESEVNASYKDVEIALDGFRGKIMQLPPMYSAKSVNGVRLYDLARQGVEVERKPCDVEIKRLELIGCEKGEYTLDVLCSKGTYIRSLIDDIGRTLGCGAVMTGLERTQAMGFTLGDCVTIDTLQSRRDNGEDFGDLIIPLSGIFKDYKKIYVSEAQAVRFSNGGALSIERIKKAPEKGEICTVYSPQGDFLGLGSSNGEELKAVKLMPQK